MSRSDTPAAVRVEPSVRPAALTFADWLDGEAGAGGTNWNRKIAGAANELRRQHSEAGQLRARIAELEAAEDGALGAWVPAAERMPASGKVVLACYQNTHGHWRRIRACWVAAKTEESGSESEIGKYDEATDTYYDPEGWYEQINNWDMYSAVAVHEGEVSHWMPMPDPPESAQRPS